MNFEGFVSRRLALSWAIRGRSHEPKIRVACKVLTRVAIKHKFACYSSRKTNNNFQFNNKAIEPRYDFIIYSRGNKSYIIELCLRDFVIL
jgi:hypothetical protein